MNTVAIIGRMLLALVLVLGVMWALARWARKPMGVGKAERVLTVLARQQLSRSSSVTVVKLMDRALVLGVTEQGVQLLTEAELAPIEQALVVEPTARRRPMLPSLAGQRATVDLADLNGLDGLNGLEPAELDGTSPATVPAGASVPPMRGSKLDGSVLSPNTWKQLIGAARELTVRR